MTLKILKAFQFLCEGPFDFVYEWTVDVAIFMAFWPIEWHVIYWNIGG